MTPETLNLISEINDLWEPIYPYLAEHIRELYGRGDGSILGEASLLEIHRVLKPNGIGFVGGGFGKHTPGKVIQNLANRSRELNLRLGKIHITEEEVRQNIHTTGLEEKAQLITEGGLWVLVRK